MKRRFTIALVLAGMATSLSAAAVDAPAAEALVRKSKCLTCHAIDKKKDGPAYKEVAAKYRDKSDALDKLTKHVTVPSKVEVDGKQEDHETLKTTDAAAVHNVVEWILTR